MEDIIIGGYTIEELTKVQKAVKKDASKVISTAIKTATDNMDTLLQFPKEDEDEEFTAEEKAQIIALAREAGEALKLADLVSGISGVEYYLPYCNDWSSDGYFYRFEGCDNGVQLFELIDENSELLGKLEDMEHQSRQWNTSTC